jgi:hypothetical protein
MTAGAPRGVTVRAAWRSGRAVLPRPDLWWTTLGALYRLAPTAWWRRWPHIPVPDARLWDFRMVTVYGTVDADPSPEDVISYLEWCRRTRPPSRMGWRAPPPSDHGLGRGQPG